MNKTILFVFRKELMMQKKNELSYKELKNYCSTAKFNFETTKELEPTNKGIGQERGIVALEFGLNVDVNRL